MPEHDPLPEGAIPADARPWCATDAEAWDAAATRRWRPRRAQLRASRKHAGDGRTRVPEPGGPSRGVWRGIATGAGTAGAVAAAVAAVCLGISETRTPEPRQGEVVTREFALSSEVASDGATGSVAVIGLGAEIQESWIVERDGRSYYGYKARIVDGRLGPDPVVWTFRVAGGAALLAAVLALLRAVTWWRAAIGLRGREVAARTVLVRAHRPGLVAVYPADDAFGRLPVFLCRVPFLPADGDRLSEAVLYGDLRKGAAVALTVPDAAQGARTEVSASALHPIRPAGRAPYRPRGTDVTAAQMSPRRAPVVWTWRPRWTVAGDRDGIHLGGPLRRRHVAWDDVASVTYARGTLAVTTRSGRRLRVLACRAETAHAAAVLDAMRAHSGLRPADADAPPPAFPLLLLTAGAAAGTALVLLPRLL